MFLDEIGELPLEVQPKLLRFLQDGEVHTIGCSAPARVPVRIVASTNRDLEAEERSGRFRADLLHRLNVISFEIPALRERREDILLLLKFFLDKYSHLPGNHSIHFSPDTLDCLMAYSWPGNVRQLSSLVLRLVSLAGAETIIFPSDLPADIAASRAAHPVKSAGADFSSLPAGHALGESSRFTLAEAVDKIARQKVLDALTRNNGNYSKAARELGLSTYGLRKKYRRLIGNGKA